MADYNQWSRFLGLPGVSVFAGTPPAGTPPAVTHTIASGTSTVVGFNAAGPPTIASGTSSIINKPTGLGSAGGQNVIVGGSSNLVVGGTRNHIVNDVTECIIVGGSDNEITGGSGNIIIGGQGNIITGGCNQVIIGGTGVVLDGTQVAPSNQAYIDAIVSTKGGLDALQANNEIMAKALSFLIKSNLPVGSAGSWYGGNKSDEAGFGKVSAAVFMESALDTIRQCERQAFVDSHRSTVGRGVIAALFEHQDDAGVPRTIDEDFMRGLDEANRRELQFQFPAEFRAAPPAEPRQAPAVDILGGATDAAWRF